jgi:hypothetical protein
MPGILKRYSPLRDLQFFPFLYSVRDGRLSRRRVLPNHLYLVQRAVHTPLAVAVVLQTLGLPEILGFHSAADVYPSLVGYDSV